MKLFIKKYWKKILLAIILFVITFGIYSLYVIYKKGKDS